MSKLNLSWHIRFNKTNNSIYVHGTEYLGCVNGKSKYKSWHLHNVIMGVLPFENRIVDHINHNTLDNRKENLRIVSDGNNSKNRKGANKNNITGFRNVHYIKEYDEYWVQICKNYKHYKWVFSKDQFEEACKFAEIKRKELFGEYAGNG